MMLTAIYYMFKTVENLNPYDYEDSKKTRPKRVALYKPHKQETKVQ